MQKLPVKSTAFMDDTTIISDGKDKLEKLISTCHSFFKINIIQANVQKYELIKINAKEKEDLNIEGVKIKKVNNEEGNRYLGFYFKHNNKRSIYKRKIKEIVDKATKIMRFKMLTEKQVTAVWNMVVIPRIEYQLQGVLLSRDLIGLKNIYDLQSEMLSKNITMRNLQLKYWTSYCLGEHGEVLTLGNNSYLGDALKILKENNLTICDHEIVDGRNYSIKGGNIKIEDIFTPLEYKKWKTSLKNKNILFLEQCLEVSKRKILKWKHLCKAQGSSIKGKSPKWYERLIELTTDKDGSRNLSCKYVNKNKNWSCRKQINLYDEENDIGKNQLITWNDNNNDIVFGKYKKKSKSKNFKKIGVHWIIENMSNMDDSPNLIKCSGCEKNISKGSKAMQHNECWIYLDNNSGARVINYRKHKDALDVEVIKPHESIDGEVSAINRLKEKWLSSQRKTLNFIQKGSSSNKKFTSGDDNALRSYKIKNLLKILPTYTILFERNCGHILTDVESEVEDWEHIWIYDDNDKSEYEILLDTLITTEKKLKGFG
ncbi:hypothetical protein RhiirC2_783091 [Rhizophagus irregularis]|uniref:Reverse transcriptase domain-containing protein n=1 Tax=Rhizophagus irregularis TaxID=588596 RepID=A0A2N1N1M7_9GLOM|nr:hypothetical protein RhiirC2_783091 [Rhizophagus irregularis]